MKEKELIRLEAAEILSGLQAALRAELQAVADYDAHAQAAASPHIRASLETLRDVEQEHASRLRTRIRALGGTPASSSLNPQPGVDSLAAQLAADLRGEQWAITEYARLVAGIVDDDETAALMIELLWDEIRHAEWLKTTLREQT